MSAAHGARKQTVQKQLFSFHRVDINKNDNLKVQAVLSELKGDKHSSSQPVGFAKNNKQKFLTKRYKNQQIMGSSLKSMENLPQNDDNAMPLLANF
jgi:hypothetical protein